MHLISVVISPEPERTRILVKALSSELLRATLPALPLEEPRALATLLEGLSLAFQQRLSVVLVVDEQVGSRCSVTFAALDNRPLFYDVGIAARDEEAIHRFDSADPDFRDLNSFRGLGP
ncbi:MAG: hypothetical protein HC923_11555 [Myxococcales bacterium]|nr:hypothetical protein [Myxococcales bacterium]